MTKKRNARFAPERGCYAKMPRHGAVGNGSIFLGTDARRAREQCSLGNCASPIPLSAMKIRAVGDRDPMDRLRKQFVGRPEAFAEAEIGHNPQAIPGTVPPESRIEPSFRARTSSSSHRRNRSCQCRPTISIQ